MDDQSAPPPPYPGLSKDTTREAWPTNGQMQYVQQPYLYPEECLFRGGRPNDFYRVPADPSIAQIRDWLVWSIINIFIGWLFIGIIPLIFSLVCRSYKKSNNITGAKTMSTFALILNILITLCGIAGWIALIFLLATGKVSVCYYNYYC